MTDTLKQAVEANEILQTDFCMGLDKRALSDVGIMKQLEVVNNYMTALKAKMETHVLVPREPTEAMMEAWDNNETDSLLPSHRIKSDYKAMIATEESK